MVTTAVTRHILFTGGGSAGHVSVNLALIPKFQAEGWTTDYIGSENGIERQLIEGLPAVRYYPIATGKLRRYFDWNNFKDPFRVMKGVLQAFRQIRAIKPDVVFSKGGFVAVPVVAAAWMNRVPVVIHESDLTPGLANKLSIPFASRVCVTFPETVEHMRSDKAVHIGAIVRDEIRRGNASKGLNACGFTRGKPVLMVMGGSLGSQRINRAVRNNLERLLEDFQVVHICGKGNIDAAFDMRGYRQFEFIREELPDLMAMTDLVVSRAGSNSIFEFLALRKPMLLIPLSRQASRGDQILNARSFARAGYCHMLEEEQLTDETFVEAVFGVQRDRADMIARMEREETEQTAQKVIDLIKAAARR